MIAWTDLESIMLSEISQAVKDKCHMISSISGTKTTKQTSEQNITRDIGKKEQPDSNQRGWRRGIVGGKREGLSRNIYQGPHSYTQLISTPGFLSVIFFYKKNLLFT